MPKPRASKPSTAPSTAAPANSGAAERVYRGVSNTQRIAERRQRLIDAAVACFGSKGFHRTTLKMLCAEAGLTERYFYESFANFDDILCCAYEHVAEIIYSEVLAAVQQAESNPAARMKAAMDCYFKCIAADPARARLILVEMESAGEHANQVHLKVLDASTELIQLEICRGLSANPDNGLSPELLASGVLGSTYHLAKRWVLSDFKPARPTIVKNVLAIFMGAVAAWDVTPNELVLPAIKKRKTA